MPKTKIATGNHATGEIGASMVISGRVSLPKMLKYRMPTPTMTDAAKPISSPTKTRIEDQPMTPSTDQIDPPSERAPIR